MIVEVKNINKELIEQKQRNKDSFAEIKCAQNEAHFSRIEQNIVTLAKPMDSCANSAYGLNSVVEATT